jgi:hypothetical protein
VIEGFKGISFRRRYRRPTDGGFILPPIKLPLKAIYTSWIGLTQRQTTMAWDRAVAADFNRMMALLQRTLDARREFEAALTEHRQLLLVAFRQHYPKAARRLMRTAQQRRNQS